MYVANTVLTEHTDKRDTGRHLVVLAKNETGYHNLIKLVSVLTEGFYSHPRTDKTELKKYSEGLIVCSACLGGEIPRLLQAGETEEAERQVEWFKSVFGEDYYIEPAAAQGHRSACQPCRFRHPGARQSRTDADSRKIRDKDSMHQ